MKNHLLRDLLRYAAIVSSSYQSTLTGASCAFRLGAVALATAFAVLFMNSLAPFLVEDATFFMFPIVRDVDVPDLAVAEAEVDADADADEKLADPFLPFL